MYRLFKTSLLLQVLLTGAYMFLVMFSVGNAWLVVFSCMLFIISMGIFGVITHYCDHNDIFKTMDKLKSERIAYVSAKKNYLNAKISEVEE